MLMLIRGWITAPQAVHHTTESFLASTAVQLTEDAKNWGERHAEDTEKKDKELDQLKTQHQRDLMRLKVGTLWQCSWIVGMGSACSRYSTAGCNSSLPAGSGGCV